MDAISKIFTKNIYKNRSNDVNFNKKISELKKLFFIALKEDIEPKISTFNNQEITAVNCLIKVWSNERKYFKSANDLYKLKDFHCHLNGKFLADNTKYNEYIKETMSYRLSLNFVY